MPTVKTSEPYKTVCRLWFNPGVGNCYTWLDFTLTYGTWSVSLNLTLDGKTISWSDLDEVSKGYIAGQVREGITCGEIYMEADKGTNREFLLGIATVKELIEVLNLCPGDFLVTCYGAETMVRVYGEDKYVVIDNDYTLGA